VRRGEVWQLDSGHRTVIVSADAVNAVGRRWCAPIVRSAGPVPPVLAVFAPSTIEADPVTGTVLLMGTTPVPAASLHAPVGVLVGATMARITDGLRVLLDIP
jgi:mRNA-degrading endonuclease toxin of MazEF toxin-antitoxin module